MKVISVRLVGLQFCIKTFNTLAPTTLHTWKKYLTDFIVWIKRTVSTRKIICYQKLEKGRNILGVKGSPIFSALSGKSGKKKWSQRGSRKMQKRNCNLQNCHLCKIARLDLCYNKRKLSSINYELPFALTFFAHELSTSTPCFTLI